MARYMTFRHLTILISLVLASCGMQDKHNKEDFSNQKEKVYASTLSNQIVYGITQDKNGHIWIGTFRGLDKYDGNTFTHYFCYSNDEGLFDNHITDVFKDSKDRMWIASVNGVCIYQDDDSFKRLELNERNRNITKIFESSDGKIFMYSSTALLYYDEESESIQPALKDSDFPYFSNFAAGSDGTIWAVSFNNIIGYNSSTYDLLGRYECPGNVSGWNIDPNGDIWLCTEKGFYIFSTISRQFSEAPAALRAKTRFNPSEVYRVFPINDVHILFATRSEDIYIYSKKSDKLVHQDDKEFPFYVPHLRNINSIFRDDTHNIWFGLEDEGFFLAERNKSIFGSYRALQERLSGEQVTSIVTNKEGSVIIAATKHAGVFTYDCMTDRIIAHKGIKAKMLLCDSRGNIWTSSETEYNVNRYTLTHGELKHDKTYPVSFILSMKEDSDGDIWFSGLGEQIWRYDYSNDSFEGVQAYKDNQFTFIPGMLSLDDSSMMVCGFYRDPVIVNTRTKQQQSLSVSGDDMKLCIKRSVMVPTAMMKDANGKVWIGTVANGLLCYDQEAKRLSPIDGSPCVDISSIEQDTNGNIWVSTMYGIGRLNPENGEFANFYFDNTGKSNQYYDRSSCVMPDGTIIFGGPHGITTIKANSGNNAIKLPLVFEDMKVYNEFLRPSEKGAISKNLSEKPKIKLTHKQNSFSISYSLLDYASSGRSHFYYKLEGYDKQWHDAGDNTEAYYTRVGAGNYTFRVRYEDDSKNVQSAEESLSISMKAAPWISWWAIALYTFIIGMIVYQIYRMRKKIKKASEEQQRLEYEKEQEKRLNKMNMSFFANVAHEFRTPLTTIKGPIDILSDSENFSKDQKKMLGVMQKSTERMMSLVDQFLDFNKLENDTLKLQVAKRNISEDLRTFVDYFEVAAKMKNIVITTEGFEDNFDMLYDQDKLYKMVSNLMSNAIKYTEVGGAIKVGFYKSGENVNIYVADNGIGIAPELREKVFERYYRIPGTSAWGTGIGLYYVKALAEVHHGSIRCTENDQNEQKKGSIFTLTLPYEDSAYKENEIVKGLSQSEQFPIKANVFEDTVDGEGSTKIMIVDDDLDICNYLKILLSSAGYNTMTCFDAESAMSRIKEWEPDLVLSDVAMPGTDGYELCRNIRNDMSISHIPVILVTAKTSVNDQVMGLDSGADAYITKPFDPKYLIALIKSQLDKRQSVQKALNESTDAEVITEEDNLSLHDKAFLGELYKVMESSMGELELDVNDLATSLHISRTKLYYKVKGLTGESPAAFFKNYKLNKAAELICEGKYNISEISDITGFTSLSHFSTSFKKHFGMTPSEYAKNKK